MTQITNFYNNLNEQIRNAQSKMALRILSRRGRNFANSMETKTDKRRAMAKFRKSQRLIKRRMKQL